VRIRALELHPATIPLARPYAVATHATDTVRMVRVCLRTDEGAFGLGAAAPEPAINGETFERCLAALRTAEPLLCGRTFAAPRELDALLRKRLPATPGARAALDMALHDLWGKAEGRPVVELLGRVHAALPTSVTIGVRDVAATLAEAREHLGRGFRVLKVKIGTDLELDVERVLRLREAAGPAVSLLVDANAAYASEHLFAFLARTRAADLQLVEQPLPPAATAAQRALPPADVARLVADESLHGVPDVEQLAREPRAFGVFNVKLMKCGGITQALALAHRAAAAGIGLLWGCMDESVVGIAAALHTAFACRATRHLDLDGSFDLARDVAAGGFVLEDGMLRTLDRPGLGVEPID
jgi:L-alanine-DL-glutamate epimerase-like enolase superfamily enzyme